MLISLRCLRIDCFIHSTIIFVMGQICFSCFPLLSGICVAHVKIRKGVFSLTTEDRETKESDTFEKVTYRKHVRIKLTFIDW